MAIQAALLQVERAMKTPPSAAEPLEACLVEISRITGLPNQPTDTVQLRALQSKATEVQAALALRRMEPGVTWRVEAPALQKVRAQVGGGGGSARVPALTFLKSMHCPRSLL
jgi:hypothetical protein